MGPVKRATRNISANMDYVIRFGTVHVPNELLSERNMKDTYPIV